MRFALEEAEQAARKGEIPIGAVIVKDGVLVSRAHNLCEYTASATAHAELLAIEAASRERKTWRLSDCTLYVTLEPCAMCAGAAINARIPRVVFAARDARAGACGSLIDLSAYPLEITPQYEQGPFEEEALALLRSFFAQKREK